MLYFGGKIVMLLYIIFHNPGHFQAKGSHVLPSGYVLFKCADLLFNFLLIELTHLQF